MEQPWTSRIDASFFDCAHCQKILKPPTFKCDAEHIVCQDCCDGHLQVCYDAVNNKSCIPCPNMDWALRAPMLFCVHKDHGCTARLAYHELANHLRSCNFTPCQCPSCDFMSSPAGLLQHFKRHCWPVLHNYVYGQPWKVPIRRRRSWTWSVAALAGESDGNVFLVRAYPQDNVMAVWVACLRASVDAHAVARQFRCELWLKVKGVRTKALFSSRVPSIDGSKLNLPSMVLAVHFRQLPSKAVLIVRIHKDGGEAVSSDDDGSSGDEISSTEEVEIDY